MIYITTRANYESTVRAYCTRSFTSFDVLSSTGHSTVDKGSIAESEPTGLLRTNKGKNARRELGKAENGFGYENENDVG